MPRKIKPPRHFLVRVSWEATGKTMQVDAKDEAHAVQKVLRMKENAGCWDVEVLREVQAWH